MPGIIVNAIMRNDRISFRTLRAHIAQTTPQLEQRGRESKFEKLLELFARDRFNFSILLHFRSCALKKIDALDYFPGRRN